MNNDIPLQSKLKNEINARLQQAAHRYALELVPQIVANLRKGQISPGSLVFSSRTYLDPGTQAELITIFASSGWHISYKQDLKGCSIYVE